MKTLLLFIAIIALALAHPTVTSDEKKNLRNSFSKATTDFYSWNIRKDLETFLLSKMSKGGATCAACNIFLSTFVSYSNLHNLTASQFLWENWCNMFPDGAVQTGCNVLVQIIGPDVETWMNEGQNPDQMCASLGLCDQPQCQMFPSDFVLKQELRLSSMQSEKMSFFSFKDLENGIKADWDKLKQVNVSELEGSLNPFGWLKSLINNFASGHLPVLDLDKDKFGGDEAGFRGYNWRGRDCDDTNANIYPGRKNNPLTPGTDYNCNGILGLDENGVDYKDKFCKNSGQMGVAVIGDSAGAHFQLPPQWMNASLMSSTTYHNILQVLEDEVDLPHMSAYTGYVQSTPDNLVNSIYQQLYQRNRCNFRDYQNIAVNGGRSSNTINNMKALKRDPQNDYPLLVFLELIGNDVCSSNPTGWTSLSDFKQNILTILNQLDETLPAGSHVFIYGLATGTVLYEYMGSRTHPLGVTYDAVYDFLNCLGKSPCAGWMNTNATIRQNTQNHADQLDQVYREIIAEGYKFKNFDYDYFDFAFAQLIQEFEAQGGQPWELIEPCDGFHPSQTANYYLANVTWQIIEKNHPDWLGAVNPFNDQIEQMFGNQGGY